MKSDEELEEFIQDWHWDKKSYKLAKELGVYICKFIDSLYEQGLSEKTISKHVDNCWCIGILECQYGYRKTFNPEEVFYSEVAGYEYEFSRKMDDSNYAIKSYRSTWKKLFNYTKSLSGISSISS